jgi:membrane fusion protein (multidrug efflux system)
MVLMLIAVGLVLGGVFGFKIFQGVMMKEYMASMGAPAQTVTTVKAEAQEWQPQFEAVGSLRAEAGVDLSAEVSGIVEAINFNSGDDVQQGAALVQLRSEDDVARLNALKAAATLAEANFKRAQKQFKVQVISKEELDTNAATYESALAQVKEQEAVIAKKTVTAPFSGHLGLRRVDLGQYVNPGTPMVTLQSLDPVYLDFFLPQQALSTVKTGLPVKVRNDTWPDRVFEGEITAIDPVVDTATRNVQLRATLKNADHALLPGMYATVDIHVGAPKEFVTLPQTAITFNPYGNTVFLVQRKGGEAQGKDGKDEPQLIAHQVFVTTGETRGDQIQVLSGVNAGDEIVSSGQLKLQNDAPIIVNNSITPSNEPNPTPSEK